MSQLKAPQTELIALTFANDTVGIMAFVTIEYSTNGLPRWARASTDENVEAEIKKASISFEPEKLPIKRWRRIVREHLPGDRTYRNALRDTGTRFVHDMPHAREIHRELLRGMRREWFSVLDVRAQRAMEEKNDSVVAQTVAQKNILRDLPADPRIEQAQTVDDLKAIWPEGLPRP